MYNAEQKEMFLDLINDKSGRTRVKRVFEKIESKEEQAGQDICNIDPQIYPDILLDSDSKIYKLATMFQFFNILMDYRRFCFVNRCVDLTLYTQYTNSEILKEDFEVTDYLLSKLDEYIIKHVDIRTPSRLLKILEDRLYGEEAYDRPYVTMSAMAKLYLLFVFLGYKESEFIKIKIEDIKIYDRENEAKYAIVRLNEKRLQKISGEYVNILIKLIKFRSLYIRTGVYQRLNDEYLFLYDNESMNDFETRAKRIYNNYSKESSKSRNLLPTIELIRHTGIIYTMCAETKGPNKLKLNMDIIEMYRKKISNTGKPCSKDYYTRKQVIAEYNSLHKLLYGNW